MLFRYRICAKRTGRQRTDDGVDQQIVSPLEQGRTRLGQRAELSVNHQGLRTIEHVDIEGRLQIFHSRSDIAFR